jgi:hypothetical protein
MAHPDDGAVVTKFNSVIKHYKEKLDELTSGVRANNYVSRLAFNLSRSLSSFAPDDIYHFAKLKGRDYNVMTDDEKNEFNTVF